MTNTSKPADIAAGVSIAAAGTSWLSSANEIITFIAGVTAIIVGLFAIISHALTIREKIANNKK
jgi:preprotein translocase subunit SecG